VDHLFCQNVYQLKNECTKHHKHELKIDLVEVLVHYWTHYAEFVGPHYYIKNITILFTIQSILDEKIKK